jgi:hypothetical protein
MNVQLNNPNTNPHRHRSPFPLRRFIHLAIALYPVGSLVEAQENWVSLANADTNALHDVEYCNGKFVAVGKGRAAVIHIDRKIRIVEQPAEYRGNLYGIDSDGMRFVAVGSISASQSGGGRLFQSPDMVTAWTENKSSFFDDLQDVVWNGERFVAVGRESAWSSSEGNNWAKHTTPAINNLQGVVWAEGRFVAVGWSGSVIHSEDGETWFSGIESSRLPNHFSDVTHGDSTFVAVAKESATAPGIAVSSDGIRWHGYRLNLPVYTELRAVTYGAGTFVAVGVNGLILTSKDGVDWNRVESPTSQNLNGIAYGNGQFIVVGQGGTILRSDAPVDRRGKVGIGRAIELEVPTRIGEVYQIRRSSDLKRWSNLGEPFEGTGETAYRLVSCRDGDSKYFDVIVSTK